MFGDMQRGGVRRVLAMAAVATMALGASGLVCANDDGKQGAAHNVFVDATIEQQLGEFAKLGSDQRVQVIVNFDTPRGRNVPKPDPNDIQSTRASVLGGLTAGSYKTVIAYSHIPAIAMEIDSAALAALRADPRVHTINENHVVMPTMVEANLWTGLVAAQVARLTGLGVTAAIIDSGVDITHPALVNDMVAQHCFRFEGDCPGGENFAVDQQGHGTHVAGIITGPNGVAPDVKFHALKVFTTAGGSDYNILSALNYVIAHPEFGIRLVNMSLGGDDYSTQTACNSGSAGYVNAFASLNANGVTVFASTGNDGYIDKVGSPGCAAGAVGVGSTGDAVFTQSFLPVCTDNAVPNKVSCFSNSHPLRGPGQMVDLLAPGCNITSTGLNGSVSEDKCGTSMATPYALGVAALVLQYDDGTARIMTPAFLEEHLKQTGLQVTDYRMTAPNNGPFPIVSPSQALPPLLTAPRHDLIANAKLVPSNLYSVTYNDTTPYAQYATLSAGDPVHACRPGSGTHSVWYAFTPTRDGIVDINTAGSRDSMADTLLSMYTGPNSALISYRCNDDNGAITTSELLDVPVTAGTRYMIQVSRYYGTPTTDLGTYMLGFSYVANVVPPPHDLFPNAKVITTNTYSDTSPDMQRATVSAGDPGHACISGAVGTHNVWYSFTPTRSGALTIDTVGSTGTMLDTVLSLYTGVPGSFTSVACNDDRPTGVESLLKEVTVTAGTKYTIHVSRFDPIATNVPGALKLNLLHQNFPAPEMTVTPLVLTAVVPVNSGSVVRTMTIANPGAQGLIWRLGTGPGSGLSAFEEGFADVNQLPGWSKINNSSPLGTTGWFQNPAFTAQAGATTHSIAANYLNASGSGTISNWLLTPVVGLDNGVLFSFWTRKQTSSFADRLEVRLSTSGASSNVGTTSTSVGDFDRLLLTINEFLGTSYPDAWTQYSVVVRNLPAAGTGRFAFRYHVANSGPNGSNGSLIAIDTVQFSSPCRSVPWLSATPGNGTISAYAAPNTVTATLNPAGLAAGTYLSTLCVNSNDAVNSLVYVPVILTVQGPPGVLFANGFD